MFICDSLLGTTNGSGGSAGSNIPRGCDTNVCCIGPGETAEIPVTIRLSRPECGRPPPVAEIDVRTALGVHRRVRASIDFDVPAFYNDCS
jgi:hypothetical protein